MKTILVFFVLFTVAHGCSQYSDCGQCMSDPLCQWCTDQDFPESYRCISKSASTTCQGLVDIGNAENALVKDDKLSKSVLIKPQEVHMNLRPGLAQDLTFTIGQSKDYPVDMYFLFDLSHSMNTSRFTLAEQSGSIIGNITEITKDLKIGFGSFIDKDLAPFKSSNPDFNCRRSDREQGLCTDPYSFYHQISLGSMEEEAFEKVVKESKLAGNVDDPEGGLDALLQVMVCKEAIGWRKNSRKIIVLASDKDYHNALDGKLIGILQPNDGKCHLDSRGMNEESKNLDYPSVSQINYIAQESSYLIIFAVSPEFQGIWKALANQIKDSSVAVLEKDAKNIVSIIKSAYEKFVGSVQVQAQGVPLEVDVKLKSRCAGGPLIETSKCQDIAYGENVDFTASITVTRCLATPVEFKLTPVGIDQSLVIKLDSNCQCPCQDPNDPGYVKDSSYCNKNGDLSCGICLCKAGFTGQNCECQENLFSSNDKDPNAACKDKSSDNPDLICNGQGDCKCGICSCHQDSRGIISGKYCQCDDFSCLRGGPFNSLCSGQGQCQCGKCSCNSDWTGDDCSCSKSTDQCLGVWSQDLCSGHGKCQCNKCYCDSDTTGALFTGNYCEKRPAEVLPCTLMAPHVECKAFQEDSDDNDCFQKLPDFDYEEVNATDFRVANANICSGSRGACSYRFTLVENSKVFLILYEDGSKTICTPYAIVAGISTVVTVFLIALVMLMVYLLYIKISDRREYARFIRERDNYKAAVNTNPLHKSPISKFQNPMYEKKSD